MAVGRLRAPTRDGDYLIVPAFEQVPAMLERNRNNLDSTIRINGRPLRELIGESRSSSLPILATGHQPELFHPGVWAKNFAVNGLAERVGGVAHNFIVDNDTLKAAELRVPSGDRVVSVPFDRAIRETTYEQRTVQDAELFQSFPRRVEELATLPDVPLVHELWPSFVNTSGSFSERFTMARVRMEQRWGIENSETRVSQLTAFPAFRHFVQHIHEHLPRFRECHNAAVRNYRRRHNLRSRSHPFPELADGESPFWRVSPEGQRERATPQTPIAELRPRAVTLTLFVRLILCDLFIHGIGGAKYDEVTDEIIREFFGLEPPQYLLVTATIHLPFARQAVPDVAAIRRRVRDLAWNPQRYLLGGSAIQEQLRSHRPTDPRERRAWYANLRRLNEQLRPAVKDQVTQAEAELAAAEQGIAIHAVRTRRDYSWMLYPEATLRRAMTAIGDSARR